MSTEKQNSASDLDRSAYTVSEAAIKLNVHVNTIYKMVKDNKLISRRIGSRGIRISKASIDNWIVLNGASIERRI